MNTTARTAPKDPSPAATATIEPSTQPEPNPAAAMSDKPEVHSPRKCVACQTEYGHDSPALVMACPQCRLPYCTDCLRTMFTAATTDPTRMPPRCCHFLQLYTAIDTLTDDEISAYRSKFEEHMTRDKLYCPRLDCSAFISPLKIPVVAATLNGCFPTVACPECPTVICTACKSFAHPGGACHTKATDDEQAMLARFGYKSCPSCNCAIARMYGCDHMMCRCGAHFCWSCLQSTQFCSGCGGGEEEDEGDVDGEYESGSDEYEYDEGDVDSDDVAKEANSDEVEKENDVKDMDGMNGYTVIESDGGSPADDPERPGAIQLSPSPSPDPIPEWVLAHYERTRARSPSASNTLPPANTEHTPGIVTEPTPAIETATVLLAQATPPTPRPRVRRLRNLDAGGEFHWADDETFDFGPEPTTDNDHTLVWECRHDFGPFQRPVDEMYNHGNLARMECNRCFTRVVPAPLGEEHPSLDAFVAVEPDVMVGQQSKSAERTSDNAEKQAWSCMPGCGWIVCSNCKDLISVSSS